MTSPPVLDSIGGGFPSLRRLHWLRRTPPPPVFLASPARPLAEAAPARSVPFPPRWIRSRIGFPPQLVAAAAGSLPCIRRRHGHPERTSVLFSLCRLFSMRQAPTLVVESRRFSIVDSVWRQRPYPAVCHLLHQSSLSSCRDLLGATISLFGDGEPAFLLATWITMCGSPLRRH